MDVLKYGGGAGMGSYVLVLRDGKLLPFTWRRVYKSFDNAEEIYLSVYENDKQISIIELEGQRTPEGLKFIGRDVLHGKTYYINQSDYDPENSLKQKIIISEGSGMPTDYKTLTGISKFLYEISYDTIDYAYANSYFSRNDLNIKKRGCSSVRNNKFFGRNFDWYYNNEATFVVRTPHYAGRNASLSIAAGVADLTIDVVDSRQLSDAYKILPFYLTDGINEKGLFCNMNVVPVDNRETQITQPQIVEEDRVCGVMLVRYILDNFDTALEAIQYLRDYVAVFMPKSLIEDNCQLHFLLGDTVTGKTYILEFINNTLVYFEHNYLTNFYFDGVNFLSSGKVYTPNDFSAGHLPGSIGITSHGMGLERWNLIVDNYESAGSKEGMRALMNQLMYSHTYTNTDNIWYSEYVGETKNYGDVTVDTNPEDSNFQQVVEIGKTNWIHRNRDEGKVWISCHSAVYDLDTKTIYVVSQEETAPNYVEYTFTFGAQDCEELAKDLAKEQSERTSDVARLDNMIIGLIVDGGEIV